MASGLLAQAQRRGGDAGECEARALVPPVRAPRVRVGGGVGEIDDGRRRRRGVEPHEGQRRAVEQVELLARAREVELLAVGAHEHGRVGDGAGRLTEQIEDGRQHDPERLRPRHDEIRTAGAPGDRDAREPGHRISPSAVVEVMSESTIDAASALSSCDT